jgi:UDP-hydrolysing UDP-N-acetyl-D-glucosamine 2-epimerase|tara:strand:+ start:3371 stop:4522 length:1152 start_codon:yes stop_codon:yes gene_type:complete
MKKICVVITNRAHYARGKLVLKAINEHPELELQLIVAGSALIDKYGKIITKIEEDGFKINKKITMLLEGGTPTAMAKTTGLGLLEFSTAFENLEPDIVLIRGDRYEILAPAIAASYLNIPLAHIEGGDVTGTIDESVRHAVTKLAHIHFPTNELSKERILKMGEIPENVYNVGSPDAEFLNSQDLTFNPNEIWKGETIGVGERPNLSKEYLIIMQHPVTTEHKKSKEQTEETIKAIHELKIPTIWIWPNVDAGTDELSKAVRVYRENTEQNHIQFVRFLDPTLFAKLLKNAACIVGNSSAGIKESSFLGTPAVNIGTRQQGRLKDKNVIDASHNSEEIKEAILKQIKNGNYNQSELYFKPNTSKQIATTLAKSKIKIQKRLNY